VNLSGIKHLIFDLGGVIINLDTRATFQAFEQLTGVPVQKWAADGPTSRLLLDYEKGLLSDDEFRHGIRQLTSHPLTDAAIDHAWNAMLGEIPKYRLDKAAALRATYGTYVLSNTNGIHEQAFNNILRQSTGTPTLQPFFDKVYFSHRMKMRKPETEIYQTVLDDNDLKGEEVLFLDDNPDNLRGAEKLKIQTFLVPSPDSWLELF
jgi:glucose-1-phosphatase